jgi:hypothetical protein
MRFRRTLRALTQTALPCMMRSRVAGARDVEGLGRATGSGSATGNRRARGALARDRRPVRSAGHERAGRDLSPADAERRGRAARPRQPLAISASASSNRPTGRSVIVRRTRLRCGGVDPPSRGDRPPRRLCTIARRRRRVVRAYRRRRRRRAASPRFDFACWPGGRARVSCSGVSMISLSGFRPYDRRPAARALEGACATVAPGVRRGDSSTGIAASPSLSSPRGWGFSQRSDGSPTGPWPTVVSGVVRSGPLLRGPPERPNVRRFPDANVRANGKEFRGFHASSFAQPFVFPTRTTFA